MAFAMYHDSCTYTPSLFVNSFNLKRKPFKWKGLNPWLTCAVFTVLSSYGWITSFSGTQRNTTTSPFSVFPPKWFGPLIWSCTTSKHALITPLTTLGAYVCNEEGPYFWKQPKFKPGLNAGYKCIEWVHQSMARPLSIPSSLNKVQ